MHLALESVLLYEPGDNTLPPPACNKIYNPPATLSFTKNLHPSSLAEWGYTLSAQPAGSTADTSGDLAMRLARTVLGNTITDESILAGARNYANAPVGTVPIPFDGNLPPVLLRALAGKYPLRKCSLTLSAEDVRITLPHYKPIPPSSVPPVPPPGYPNPLHDQLGWLRFSLPPGLALYNWTLAVDDAAPKGQTRGIAAGAQPLPPLGDGPFVDPDRCMPFNTSTRQGCFARQNEVLVTLTPSLYRDRLFYDSAGEKVYRGYRPGFQAYIVQAVHEPSNDLLPHSHLQKPLYLARHSALTAEAIRDLKAHSVAPNAWRETVAILFDRSSLMVETIRVPKYAVLHLLGTLFGLFVGTMFLFRTFFIALMGDPLPPFIIDNEVEESDGKDASGNTAPSDPKVGKKLTKRQSSFARIRPSSIFFKANPLRLDEAVQRVTITPEDASDDVYAPTRSKARNFMDASEPSHRNVFAPSVSQAAATAQEARKGISSTHYANNAWRPTLEGSMVSTDPSHTTHTQSTSVLDPDVALDFPAEVKWNASATIELPSVAPSKSKSMGDTPTHWKRFKNALRSHRSITSKAPSKMESASELYSNSNM